MSAYCTQALTGAVSNGTDTTDVVCNSLLTSEKCLRYTACMWRNDSCFCTFVGCSCGDPAQGAHGSNQPSDTLMYLILIPAFILLVAVS
mmetsp:Transcript_23431/g.63262  ORF Transcript_23431/g.63262 Transcript_23431/m.63262 type:complete len:89 (+) Transcript_23431:41-307(+)